LKSLKHAFKNRTQVAILQKVWFDNSADVLSEERDRALSQVNHELSFVLGLIQGLKLEKNELPRDFIFYARALLGMKVDLIGAAA